MTKPLRDVFGEALVELGAKNPDVIVLDADLAGATRSIFFGKKYPERFFNVGITEANMVSIAAGLSTCGKIPFACTFSFLLTLRTGDQIRSQISYPGLNVKLVGCNGGLSGYGDGVSHQSIMDLAILRAMPNMTVIVPSDEVEIRQAVQKAARHQGPVFIRIPRVSAPVLHQPDMSFEFSKGICLRQGTDVTIVAMGMMVSRTLDAAEELASRGIDTEVLEIHTIKPIDTELITKSVSKTGAVVTVEEHNRYGGLFSAVSEVIGLKHPVPIEYVAIEDRYGGSGQYEELLEDCGLTVQNIIDKAEHSVKRKMEYK
ncbi:MAG: transketolase family protein [bacterium]|nr:MAG: transketolase family protein [bacterium]